MIDHGAARATAVFALREQDQNIGKNNDFALCTANVGQTAAEALDPEALLGIDIHRRDVVVSVGNLCCASGFQLREYTVA